MDADRGPGHGYHHCGLLAQYIQLAYHSGILSFQRAAKLWTRLDVFAGNGAGSSTDIDNGGSTSIDLLPIVPVIIIEQSITALKTYKFQQQQQELSCRSDMQPHSHAVWSCPELGILHHVWSQDNGRPFQSAIKTDSPVLLGLGSLARYVPARQKRRWQLLALHGCKYDAWVQILDRLCPFAGNRAGNCRSHICTLLSTANSTANWWRRRKRPKKLCINGQAYILLATMDMRGLFTRPNDNENKSFNEMWTSL